MTSFIELPRLQFGGRPTPSLYVNVDDIVALNEEWDGQTKVQVRDLGSEGMTANVVTFVPLARVLDVLGNLAKFPGVTSWTDDVKAEWSAPVTAAMKAGAEAERAAERRFA